MIRRGQSDAVKSVGRTIEVLQLFQKIRRPLTLMEIARQLSWPQSSTSEIMHTLVNLDYLIHDRADRTYFPSMRVVLLGEWLDKSVFREGTVTRLINELNRRTGDAIIVACRSDTRLEVLNTISSTDNTKRITRRGDSCVITDASLGHTLLASYDDTFVEKLVRRINAYEPDRKQRMTMRDLRPILAEIRAQGYCYGENGAVRDGGLVAMLLLAQSHEERLVIGISGPIERIRTRRQQLVEILGEAVRQIAPQW